MLAAAGRISALFVEGLASPLILFASTPEISSIEVNTTLVKLETDLSSIVGVVIGISIEHGSTESAIFETHEEDVESFCMVILMVTV